MPSILTQTDLENAFRALGVTAEQTVMAHVSLSRLGFVVGGAEAVIRALLGTVGEDGTVMTPAQSWKNLDPETGVHGDVPEAWYPVIRDNWPAYDPEITPTNTMGAVAEMFRRWPGTVRSAHPARSVAANGKWAAYLTKKHTLSDIFGEGSPLARLYALDGYVLLLGVGYDKNTSLHLADARASYPQKHTVTEHSAVTEGGRRVWKAYETLYVDGADFDRIGEAFEQTGTVRRMRIGDAEARLMPQRALVDFAVDWIEKNRR